MASLDDRRIAAICGVFPGDAAAQPLHWIYHQEKLEGLLGETEEVEFWPTSNNPFYTLVTGKNSCYADQSLVVLKSLVDNKGLDIPALKKATLDFFGPGTIYDNPNRGGGNKNPIEGCWLHKSLMDFLQNYKEGKMETGSVDKSADCCVRLVPVVALYVGKPEMLERVREAVKVTQNDEDLLASAMAAARVLENYMLKGPNPSAIEEVITELSNPGRNSPNVLDAQVAEYLRQVLNSKSSPHTEVAAKFGKNCYVPGNLQSSLHAIINNDSYATAVRTTIRAGGCNASRSGYVGACLAAQYGLDAIPETWKKRTFRFAEALQLGKQLITEN